MGDGIRAFGVGDVDLVFGDQRAGDRGAEKIVGFVDSAGLEHGEAILLGKFLAEVFDDALVGAGREGLLLDPFEFIPLAELGGEGDDFAAGIIVFEPGEDDGGIEPAGVGEDDFLGKGMGGHGVSRKRGKNFKPCIVGGAGRFRNGCGGVKTRDEDGG